MDKRVERWAWPAGGVLARVALAAGFLSAVADRFGLWGPGGTGHVSWGDLAHFQRYLHMLAPYLPESTVAVVGWAATLTELTLGIALLLGILPRWSALASAATLMVFGLSMFFFSGFEAPLSASVFSAASAALLLALAPDRAFVLSAVPTFQRDLLARSSGTGAVPKEVGQA